MEGFPEDEGKNKGALKLKTTLAVYGALSAAAFVWGLACGRPFIFLHPRNDGGHEPAELLMQMGAGLLFALAVVIMGKWAAQRFLWVRRLESEFARLIGPLSTPDIIITAVVSGLAEELFFRGAMQPTLGLVLTSFIFGLLHMGPSRQFWPWTAFALLMGFALGWFFEESGTLAAPITAHIVINLLNLLRLRRRWYDMQTGPQSN